MRLIIVSFIREENNKIKGESNSLLLLLLLLLIALILLLLLLGLALVVFSVVLSVLSCGF
jgi:hypothetical protein